MKPLEDKANGVAEVSQNPARATEDEMTGIPWLRSWKGVYVFVLGSFILWVALLVALTVSFS
jgi:hypothetical protein